MIRFAALASFAILLALAPARAVAASPGREPGTYWEHTAEMQMGGFAMPPQTQKVCMPKASWQEPPKAGQDDSCKITDVKRTASRMSWKMECRDGMKGAGEMTHSPDAFSGTITMRGDGQDMRMKVKGRRLGGDCDAGELKRQVAEAQQAADAAQAEHARGLEAACEDAAESMHLMMFVSPIKGVPPQCPDATRFCARLETREGLAAFRQGSEEDGARASAGKLCKKDLAAIEAKLCGATAKDLERGKRADAASLEFVFASCPDQAKALAKRECAGRKFTALPPAQRDFCIRWAQGNLEADAQPEPVEEAPSPADAVKSRIIKGIFGR